MSIDIVVSFEERAMVVSALRAYETEYADLAGGNVSRFLAEELGQKAVAIARLRERIEQTIDKNELNQKILDLMASNQKINAIKMVRANTMLGLKEAKDYVEKVDNEARERFANSGTLS